MDMNMTLNYNNLPPSFIIEGIDRLGKSTLCKNLMNRLGYKLKIHYSKPELLDIYSILDNPLLTYQVNLNMQMFKLIESGVPCVFDRGYLGEAIYAPLYRNYSGDYVYTIEASSDTSNVALILLTTSNLDLCIDDGESFDFDKRGDEQNLFIEAFNRCTIKNKIIIDVYDRKTDTFRPEVDIIEELLIKVSKLNKKSVQTK